ncbi:MAG: hypothetical protein JXN61_17420, partial [Sedimentisphaerales bacterium]|nr:hypothetical protein [Sedimentisphaerales bacterium]
MPPIRSFDDAHFDRLSACRAGFLVMKTGTGWMRGWPSLRDKFPGDKCRRALNAREDPQHKVGGLREGDAGAK